MEDQMEDELEAGLGSFGLFPVVKRQAKGGN